MEAKKQKLIYAVIFIAAIIAFLFALNGRYMMYDDMILDKWTKKIMIEQNGKLIDLVDYE